MSRLLAFENFSERAEMYAVNDDLTTNPLFIAREFEAIDATGRREAFDARAKYLQTKNRVVTVVRRSASAPIGGRVLEGTVK